MKNELKFFRKILEAYQIKYGTDLTTEVIEDMIKRSGITDEDPLKIKSQLVLLNKYKFDLKDKEDEK